jgi:hypothetical protein
MSAYAPLAVSQTVSSRIRKSLGKKRISNLNAGQQDDDDDDDTPDNKANARW